MRSLGIVLTVVLLSSTATFAIAPAERIDAAAVEVRGGPRVRPHDSRIAALLVEGIARSSRLRHLIDRIEQSDLIVYIETQPALRGRVAGSLTWLTKTALFRYVRVSISPDQFGEPGIALLAHELQHALEVAEAASVVDPSSLEALYRKIGQRVGVHVSGWDTEAARVVGEDVRRELAASRATRITESSEPFDPLAWHIVYRRARERAQ